MPRSMGIALCQLDTYVPPQNVTSSYLFHGAPTELLKNLTTRRDNADDRNASSNKTPLWPDGPALGPSQIRPFF